MTNIMRAWTDAMRTGRYTTAWNIAMKDLRARDPATRDDASLPYHRRWVWDGRDFRNCEVLVRCYHGLGDTLQFARYLPVLARQATSVTVEAQPSLLPLLASVPGIDRLIPFDQAAPVPASECDIEITELPLALRSPPTAVNAPYMRASRAVLPRGTIALCHLAGDWDPDRSVPEELLAPLCTLAPCVTLAPRPTELPVLNPRGCPMDMEITATFISGADLVITVDSMVAHLAGALGRPTWLLLKSDPDWRWSPHQTSSPWYPTMRLYTQPEPGDWGSVLARVTDHLALRRSMTKKG